MPYAWVPAALLFMLSLPGVAAAQAPPAPEVHRLHRVPGGLVAVDVSVNGAGPFRLLVDTGSSRTVVTPTLAAAAAMETLPGARLVTPNGVREVRQGWPALSFGSLQVARLPVSVLPMDVVAVEARGLDGVLGNDVLARMSYALDFDAMTLTILDESTAEAGRGSEVPFSVDGTGRMRVEVTTAWTNGVAISLLVDSGASSLVLYADRLPVLPRAGAAVARVQTVAAQSRMSALGADWITVGPETWDRVDALMAPSASGAAAGLLPLRLASRVLVNNTTRTLTFVR